MSAPGGFSPRSDGAATGTPSPIESLDTATALKIELVAFDVDDTFTTHGVLSRDAYTALWSLHESGLRLVAATGRPHGWADVWARLWPIDYAVAENGACWVWREGGGTRTGYTVSDAEREQQRQTLARIREHVVAKVARAKVAQDQSMRATDLAFDIGETQRLSTEEVEAIRTIMLAHGARTMVSSVHVHAYFGEHDKGTGIRDAHRARYARALDPSTVLFLGDSPNDAGAFAAFSATVGVANIAPSLDRLPVAPRFITRHEAGAGFAEAVSCLLERRAG